MSDPLNPRNILRRLFYEGLRSADPYAATVNHLPEPTKGRTLVVGAGKAAALMAKAIEDNWEGPLEGLVIVPYGHGAPTNQIEVVEAGHPIPDEAGEYASREILTRAKFLKEGDLVISLISGGGSSLMSVPQDGIMLDDKRKITRHLLLEGATIAELNTVRRHLSAIKGGRLAAAAYPARVETLVISDVPGDNPAMVASGPTVADKTTEQQAIDILKRYEVPVSKNIIEILENGANETPKPDSPIFYKTRTHVILSAYNAMEAAKREALKMGIKAIVLGDDLEGEARDLGEKHAQIALGLREEKMPCVLISGGETTVNVRGMGLGGRNGEYLLSMALALDGEADIYALACDTDGIDGGGDNAGAIITPTTLMRAAGEDLSAWGMLEDNDSYNFFGAIGDLVITGPTRTNVNDFRAVLVV
ncbi:MAG: glycerate kinase [Sphingomonadales bacterium]|nr:glycerate kinase [Sphingomonadales bacterium]